MAIFPLGMRIEMKNASCFAGGGGDGSDGGGAAGEGGGGQGACQGRCVSKSDLLMCVVILGPLGFNFSQHGPTTRPSRSKDCRESIYAGLVIHNLSLSPATCGVTSGPHAVTRSSSKEGSYLSS